MTEIEKIICPVCMEFVEVDTEVAHGDHSFLLTCKTMGRLKNG